MIISHQQDNDGQYAFIQLEGSEIKRYKRKPMSDSEFNYRLGVSKPNYPMPAIPSRVNIQPCAVWIYELPDERTEHIVFLALDWERTSNPIWG